MKKLTVAVLCGGQSAEHEVSLRSAKNVIEALDRQRYDVLPIVITRAGDWILLDDEKSTLTNPKGRFVSLLLSANPGLITLDNETKRIAVDIVFPVLHGPCGEDGTIQGVLALAKIPFVGSGVLGSALCMDKVISKQLLACADVPITRWYSVVREDISTLDIEKLIQLLGLPMFVKPASIGSSIGISKAHNKTELLEAIESALRYDHKIIFEQFVAGREFECAVLGNENPKASIPAEIIPTREFYDYEAKYGDPEGATLVVQADLPKLIIERVQEYSIRAFKVLNCSGMVRVDFFVTDNQEIFINELNTIPGFTNISLYPQMWVASGMTYGELIDRLIQLAIEKFQRDALLTNTYSASGVTSL